MFQSRGARQMGWLSFKNLWCAPLYLIVCKTCLGQGAKVGVQDKRDGYHLKIFGVHAPLYLIVCKTCLGLGACSNRKVLEFDCFDIESEHFQWYMCT